MCNSYQQSFNFVSTVLDVKQALQEKEGIQVDQIRWVGEFVVTSSTNIVHHRLIYSGKQLADEKTLSEYNVTAGGTIHMVLQLR